jgi:hypothetical protein
MLNKQRQFLIARRMIIYNGDKINLVQAEGKAMKLCARIRTLIVISVLCLAVLLSSGAVPARADGPEKSALPYSKTWGNSAGRTGANAGAWGKSDTTMGCSGINNNSKCLFTPCKFCIRQKD